MSPTRYPAVAGRFYPAGSTQLRAEINSYLIPAKKTQARACIVPHAGYMYSGHVAGAVFSQLEIPDTIILLCPNHTGRGCAPGYLQQR